MPLAVGNPYKIEIITASGCMTIVQCLSLCNAENGSEEILKNDGQVQ